MHDYFDVLGLPTGAAASEIRRVCARRVRRAHPDFRCASGTSGAVLDRPEVLSPIADDVAIDFVEMAALVDRIQGAFFETPR